jgi:hypothetical protein
MSSRNLLRSMVFSRDAERKMGELDRLTEQLVSMRLTDCLLSERFFNSIVDFGVQILADGREFFWMALNIGVAFLSLAIPLYKTCGLILLDIVVFHDELPEEAVPLGPPI